MSNLKKYNQKRNFNKTKEPKGKKEISKNKLRFVVQHHLARKDHYDLRLEYKGVLLSWAIPKGPSYNHEDKRLAILVEDHPLSYRNFEGTIPKGEYGGGTVMIWDEGYYEALTNIKKGKMIKFILKGKRLKGKWTLVPFKNNNWLLIKEKDKFYEYADINEFKTSVRTGKTFLEIEKNTPPKRKITNLKKGIVAGIKITNPDKVIFKKEGITKLDLAFYYHKVAKRMLPFLKNRIISTIRCPKEITKEKFFMKHFNNPSLKKIKLRSKNKEKNDYYYITDEEGLIKEVQMNSYEFHTWGSTVNNLEFPDIMIFDLDPFELLPLKKLREGVKDLKKILDDLKLKSFLKTSGGKGYHVLVLLKKKMNWSNFSKTAYNIAKLMEIKHPDKYTTNNRLKNRKGKIFIDYLRNTRSSTSVAPYSIRLRPNCPVSMPLSWDELDKIKPDEITLKKALEKIKKKNPWSKFFF